MADVKAKPQLNAIGMPSPETDQPVEPYDASKPVGERQDGPGIGPTFADRRDDSPPGEASRQRQAGTPQGQPEEPDADHRGKPAGLTTGAATGSGAGAGGGGAGPIEEPDSDSAGGGGREPGFSHQRDLPSSGGDASKHGSR